MKNSMLKNKTLKIITIGGATQDVFFETDKAVMIDNSEDLIRQKLIGFEYGAKINIPTAHFCFGGGASNSAVTLSRLGAKVTSFIAVGNDKIGQAICNNLILEKVNIFNLEFSKKSSGFSCAIVYGRKTKDHVLFTYRGANEDLQIDSSNINQIEKIKPDWIYLSSLSGKKWLGVLNKLVALAFKNNIKLAWNPGNFQIKTGLNNLKSFLNKTEVLILNKDEARILVLSDKKYSKEKVRLNDVRFLLKVLKGWGPNIIVITQGSKGASIYEGRKFYHLPAFKVKMLNATGAGDAFGASFIAGLILYNYDIEKSLKLAIVNSAYVTTKVGAQNGLLTRKEAEKKMGCK